MAISKRGKPIKKQAKKATITRIDRNKLKPPDFLPPRMLELFNAILRECDQVGVKLTARNQTPTLVFASLLETIERHKAAILEGTGGIHIVELFNALVSVGACAEEFGLNRQILANLILLPQGLDAFTAEYMAEYLAAHPEAAADLTLNAKRATKKPSLKKPPRKPKR
jgi:hypothetical protein